MTTGIIAPHIDFETDAYLSRRFHEKAAEAEQYADVSRYWLTEFVEYRAKAEVRSGMFLDRYCS